MSIPYTRSLRVTATSGQHNLVALGAPIRGILERLIIKQIDGDLEGYAVDVLDRKDAVEGETSLSDNPDDGTTLLAKELHKVMATITVAAAAATYEGFDLAKPYENRDEQDPNSRRQTMAIYLDLEPSGSGDKQFEIAYTITNAMD